MKLLVDNREPKELISILTNRFKNVELGNLELGDFIIKNDADETIMMFERKSLSDLVASIKDGRYAEQSFRLSQVPINNHNIYYIIEGNILDFCTKNNEPIQKMVFSSMLSLTYKKGFSLLRTMNFIETAELLIRFVEKLQIEKIVIPQIVISDPQQPICHVTPEPYSSVIKTSKKSNITRENIGEIMLSQIPGLSISVAQALMNKFKTIKNLIVELTKDNKCLDTFTVECKNGPRKISKTVVKHLIEFLDVEN
jgi:ERCC4-type nuclease